MKRIPIFLRWLLEISVILFTVVSLHGSVFSQEVPPCIDILGNPPDDIRGAINDNIATIRLSRSQSGVDVESGDQFIQVQELSSLPNAISQMLNTEDERELQIHFTNFSSPVEAQNVIWTLRHELGRHASGYSYPISGNLEQAFKSTINFTPPENSPKDERARDYWNALYTRYNWNEAKVDPIEPAPIPLPIGSSEGIATQTFVITIPRNVTAPSPSFRVKTFFQKNDLLPSSGVIQEDIYTVLRRSTMRSASIKDAARAIIDELEDKHVNQLRAEAQAWDMIILEIGPVEITPNAVLVAVN